jgi:hypothetical protein
VGVLSISILAASSSQMMGCGIKHGMCFAITTSVIDHTWILEHESVTKSGAKGVGIHGQLFKLRNRNILTYFTTSYILHDQLIFPTFFIQNIEIQVVTM